jgi:hypothetical protein
VTVPTIRSSETTRSDSLRLAVAIEQCVQIDCGSFARPISLVAIGVREREPKSKRVEHADHQPDLSGRLSASKH